LRPPRQDEWSEINEQVEAMLDELGGDTAEVAEDAIPVR